MSQPTERSTAPRKYGHFGITLSAGIAVLVGIYFVLEWSAIKAMTPNEFGDLLAGILGPLALLWLVLGFFQQGEELRHSVHALELQSQELRNSVEQQAALVEVTREQAQAELAALQEERQARRAASAPRFTVHAGGGSRSGTHLKQNVTMHNVGAIASDVRVIIRDEERVYLDRFFSVWDGGSQERLQIGYEVQDRPKVLIVNAICRDRFGEEVAQEVRLTADPESQHRYVIAPPLPEQL